MVLSFDIPNPKATRIGAALTLVGYAYNPQNPATDDQQRIAYLKTITVAYWREIVENYEKEVVKQQAVESRTPIDTSDIL